MVKTWKNPILWRKVGVVTLYLFLVGLTISLMSFSNEFNRQLPCWKIEVNMEGDENARSLVSETEVLNLCSQVQGGIIGKRFQEISIGDLRGELLKNKFIRKSNVYLSLDGRCMIDVMVRKPIARILDVMGRSYYLDACGFAMPLKEDYSADVPLFTGSFESPVFEGDLNLNPNVTWACKDIFVIAQLIQENPLWNAQIDHLFWDHRWGWTAVPRVGDHVVRLGEIASVKDKLDNLFVFYTKLIPHIDLDQYDTLDARFGNQIVGIKRNYAL